MANRKQTLRVAFPPRMLESALGILEMKVYKQKKTTKSSGSEVTRVFILSAHMDFTNIHYVDIQGSSQKSTTNQENDFTQEDPTKNLTFLRYPKIQGDIWALNVIEGEEKGQGFLALSGIKTSLGTMTYFVELRDVITLEVHRKFPTEIFVRPLQLGLVPSESPETPPRYWFLAEDRVHHLIHLHQTSRLKLRQTSFPASAEAETNNPALFCNKFPSLQFPLTDASTDNYVQFVENIEELGAIYIVSGYYQEYHHILAVK